MRAKIFRSLLAMACLLGSTNVSAYDFEVDGICYDITSFTDLEVKATSVLETTSGEIVIPAEVTFNNKTLKVIGIGENFVVENANITKLIITSGVIFIENNAFKGCANLSEVTLPSTTTQIGASVFQDCISLEAFESDSIISVGVSAFSGCVSLKSISLNNLTKIEANTFLGCINLENCDFPIISTIDKSAFKDCTSLASFEISNTVISIGESAFENSGIVNLTIPNNVTELGFYAYRNCNALEYVSIGTGIETLHPIFDGCNNLITLRIEDSPSTLEIDYSGNRTYTSIGTGPANYSSRDYTPSSPMFADFNIKEVYIGRNLITLDYCYKDEYYDGSYDHRFFYYTPNPPFSNTKIEKLTIGALVSNLTMNANKSSGYGVYVHGTWSGAFQGCSELEEIENNTCATIVPKNTFEGCSKIKNIELPSSIEIVETNALANCSSLEELNLGCHVSSLGAGSLSGCSMLRKINFRNPNPPTYSTGFASEEYIYTTIRVPSGSLSSYKESDPWKNFWNIEESKDLISLFEVDGIEYMVTSGTDVTIIGENLSQQTDLIIKSQVEYSDIMFNVVSISSDAFKNCLNLSTINIGTGIRSIGDNCFEGCSNLYDIILPSSIISIGNASFKNCSSITNIVLPTQITIIPSECFYGCTLLNEIELTNITELGSQCFQYCRGLESLSIPNSVTKFGESVFSGCSNLKELIFEDGMQPLFFPSGSYDGATNIQKKEINGKTIQFKIQYYNGYFSGLSLEKLYLGRNLSDDKRYTITGDGGVDYYLITSYDTPFCSLSELKELVIGKNVSVLGPSEEFISEIETNVTAGAFKSCSAIQTINVENPTPPSGAEFSSSVYANAQLYVPANTSNLYSIAEGWKDFWNLQEVGTSGVDHIIDKGQAAKEVKRYNVAGREINSLQKGLNIIKMSDGTTKKVIMR